MMRVFIDSSVLIAASYSSTGASREIIRQAIRGTLSLVVSSLVLEETARNLAIKAPEALPAFQQFLDAIPFETVRPTKGQVLESAQFADFQRSTSSAKIVSGFPLRLTIFSPAVRFHLSVRPQR